KASGFVFDFDEANRIARLQVEQADVVPFVAGVGVREIDASANDFGGVFHFEITVRRLGAADVGHGDGDKILASFGDGRGEFGPCARAVVVGEARAVGAQHVRAAFRGAAAHAVAFTIGRR